MPLLGMWSKSTVYVASGILFELYVTFNCKLSGVGISPNTPGCMVAVIADDDDDSRWYTYTLFVEIISPVE